MMTIGMFTDSVSGAAPPEGLGVPLQALWWTRKGDWDRAHACVQQNEGNPDCDLIHAHLHREEGDLANARLWYQGVGRAMPEMPLAEEWTELATGMLARG